MDADTTLEPKPKAEATADPVAPQDENKPESSELESDQLAQGQSKNVEGDNPQEDNQEDEELGYYKSAYEKAQDSLKKAEHTIVKLKKDKKEDQGIDLTAIKDELRDEVVRELEQSVSGVMKKQLEDFRVEDRENYIADRIKEMSKNEYEAKMIAEFYRDKLNKTGMTKEAIQSDLSLAKGMVDGLVNAERISKENNELRETLISKSNISPPVGASVKEPKSNYANPSLEDHKMADKFFQGNMERWMKYKVKNN